MIYTLLYVCTVLGLSVALIEIIEKRGSIKLITIIKIVLVTWPLVVLKNAASR